MKPEDLTPQQAMQLIGIGAIFMSVLCGSIVSWILFAIFRSQRKRFQTAKFPLATIGLVDCTVGMILLIFLMFVASQAWDAVLGKPVSNQLPTNRESIQDTRKADNGKSSTNIETSEDSIQSQSSTDGTEQQAKSSRASNSGQIDSIWKNVSADQFLYSGWLSIAQLITALVTGLFILLRTGCSARWLGWQPRNLLKDLAYGTWVLFMFFPILMLVSAVVSAVSRVPYSHPIIDAIKNYPWLIGVVAWQAVIVAPLTEEFLFRTLLIGWFESIHFGKDRWSTALTGWQPATMCEVTTDESSILTEVSGDSALSNLSKPTVQVEQKGQSALESTAIVNAERCKDENYQAPWWPSLVSGTLFGLAHASYGVSWVPLILFGIVLGRVYQMRQSLIICIAIHMIFNAVNLVNLWLSVGLPQIK